jgi:hypothetical protein
MKKFRLKWIEVCNKIIKGWYLKKPKCKSVSMQSPTKSFSNIIQTTRTPTYASLHKRVASTCNWPIFQLTVHSLPTSILMPGKLIWPISMSNPCWEFCDRCMVKSWLLIRLQNFQNFIKSSLHFKLMITRLILKRKLNQKLLFSNRLNFYSSALLTTFWSIMS